MCCWQGLQKIEFMATVSDNGAYTGAIKQYFLFSNENLRNAFRGLEDFTWWT